MKKVIEFLLSIIDKEVAIDTIINFLKKQAERTDIKLDDKIVALLELHKNKIKGE